MLIFKCSLIIITQLVFTLVFAHAYLSESTPASSSIIKKLPSEVVLVMSEPIELLFSTFKIYPLEIMPEMNKRDIILAAKTLTKEVILLQNDEEQRLDTGILNEKMQNDTVRLGLKESIAAGTYVIMWRLLSIDSHTSADFTFFTYSPEKDLEPQILTND